MSKRSCSSNMKSAEEPGIGSANSPVSVSSICQFFQSCCTYVLALRTSEVVPKRMFVEEWLCHREK